MRINFKKIEIHNFLSFTDDTFNFEDHHGMTMICGQNNDIPGSKNGAGKSAIWSALIFCLFGETQNGIKNENIHNRYSENKDVRVITYFSIDGNNYKIATSLSKYNQTTCTVCRLDNENEVDLTKSTIFETRKFLEKEIFRCDISIFLRTIYLSSDQTYNFFNLRRSDKKDFIEKLFDISIFGNMYTEIHRDILTADKELLAHQNTLLVLNKTDEEYSNCIREYESSKKEKILRLEANIKKVRDEYASLKNTSVAINTEQVDKFENAINKINSIINSLLATGQQLSKQRELAEVELHKFQLSKQQKEKMVNSHNDLLNKLCSGCSTVFKKYYNLDTYTEEISKLIKEIEAVSKNIEKICKDQQSTITKVDTLLEKQHTAEQKLKELTATSVQTNKELIQLESRIEALAGELTRTVDDTNPYIRLFEGNKSKITEEIKSLDSISDKYRYLKFAENIVSQDTLRKFIIKDLIGLLNTKIKVYLSKVGARYTVIFDEDMNYEFITDGGTCEYGNFSAGERVRIMIATCFAFRDFMAIRNNLSSNILILDEFIDGNIDAIAIEGIISILKDFIGMYDQNVYIISHREEIDNSIFDNIIQVVKTNNISKIKYLIQK